MRLPVQVAILAALAAGSAFADDWTKTFAVRASPSCASKPTTPPSLCGPGTTEDCGPCHHGRLEDWPGRSGSWAIQAGNRVEITVRTSRRRFPFFSIGMHSIEVDIEAPRQIESNIRTGGWQHRRDRSPGRDPAAHRRRPHRGRLHRRIDRSHYRRRPHARARPPGFAEFAHRGWRHRCPKRFRARRSPPVGGWNPAMEA